MICRRCKLPLVRVGTNIWRHAIAVERQVTGRDDARYWTCGTKPIAHMQNGHTRTLFREGQDPDRLRGEKVVVL